MCECGFSHCTDSGPAGHNYALLPEYALTYLVHLLAHHPDFGLTTEDLRDTERYLDFYLSHCAKSEGFSFLKALMETVKQHLDRQSPEESHVGALCRRLCAVLRGWAQWLRARGRLAHLPKLGWLPRTETVCRVRYCPGADSPPRPKAGLDTAGPPRSGRFAGGLVWSARGWGKSTHTVCCVCVCGGGGGVWWGDAMRFCGDGLLSCDERSAR